MKHTRLIKEEAGRLGFSFCGISKAEYMEEEAPRLEQWLRSNMHGQMHYMANHFDKRLDPRLLVPGARSVVSLLLNYFSDKKQTDPTAPKISMYVFGDDYHKVIKKKLQSLLHFISENIGEAAGRAFVDSAPVLDRAWAKRSGLGWVGKNTNLIHPQAGSYFFVAELILDMELQPDAPIKDYCGTCTACIDACPTDAIIKPYVVDGSKCISYFTIELKDQVPDEIKSRSEGWAFGCDICQEVCPWNRFSQPHNHPELNENTQMLEMKRSEWLELTEEVFRNVFKNSALKRAGYTKLMDTIVMRDCQHGADDKGY